MAKIATLQAWVKRERRGALTRLARVSGLAYTTVHKAFRGEPIRYDTAVKLSKATGGAVAVRAFPLIGDEVAA